MERIWGTPDCAGLTKRMAQRGVRLLKSKNRKLKVVDVLYGLTGLRNHAKPRWLPQDEDMNFYFDDWDDWRPEEIQVLVARLAMEVPAIIVQTVFQVSDELMREAYEQSKNYVPAHHLSEDAPDDGQVALSLFTTDEIADQKVLDFANSRLRDYATRVDMDNPSNASTVRSMIVTEVKLRDVEEQMLKTKDAKELNSLQETFSALRKIFSAAALDMGQLERQFQRKRQEETLDAVITRTNDIRRNWRRDHTANMMAENNLYRLEARYHRVALEKRGEVLADLPPTTPTGRPPISSAEIQTQIAEHAPKDEDPMYAEGVESQ